MQLIHGPMQSNRDMATGKSVDTYGGIVEWQHVRNGKMNVLISEDVPALHGRKLFHFYFAFAEMEPDVALELMRRN